MRTWIAALVVFWGLPAFAVVDMKAANFADSWTDLSLPGTGYDLFIQRTYNSRTIFSGMFGFGWCSDYETRLEITPEGNPKVFECGAGAEVLYTAKKFDVKKVDETVNAIMAEVKKRNSTLNEKSLNEIKGDLKDDDFFREQFARRVGVKGSVDKDTVYFANGRESETINRQPENFKRSLADGSYQLFDLQGRLTHIYDRNSNYLKMQYDNSQLTGIIDNQGRRLTLSYDKATRKVKKIVGPNNLVAEYVTKGEDLVEVTNGWKKKFKYKYDDVHNLIKIDLPNGTNKSIAYNKDKDWVISFQNQKGCIENYEYKVNPEDPKLHFWSTVTKKCGTEITNKSVYEFFNKPRTDNSGIYLARVRSDNNGAITDITYHEIFGKPVTIVRGQIRTEFSYFDNGLVKGKREPGRMLAFEYKNSCNKPSKLDIDYVEPVAGKTDKLKVLKKSTTTFTYEPKKCILTFAKNSDGQMVKLQYDTHGRIVQIEDQSKKIMKIKYEEKFGKPEVVTRPGLGTMKISYKADGEINNVESKDGPRVAVQVASIFSNYLDIIASASAEASL